jgi:hypothetical protein
LQNSPLESSCVVVALIENYSTSKPLKVSSEKSLILICDSVVGNERYNLAGLGIESYQNSDDADDASLKRWFAGTI